MSFPPLATGVRLLPSPLQCAENADVLTLCNADLLQVLSILTMERPVSFSAEDIRDEKVGVTLLSR